MPFGEIIAFLLSESYGNCALCERNVACLHSTLDEFGVYWTVHRCDN